MKFVEKLKKNRKEFHLWVKIALVIFGIVILVGIAVLIKNGFFGFGEWIGRTLKIPRY